MPLQHVSWHSGTPSRLANSGFPRQSDLPGSYGNDTRRRRARSERDSGVCADLQTLWKANRVRQ